MTSSEAHANDPMCRMLLEHTYEAIIDAGVNLKELRGTKTGVFIGSCSTEIKNIIIYYRPQADGYPIVGRSKYWLANSISNWFGLNGPSYALDTACSSTHHAMAEAYRMIRSGKCDAAIVGGTNMCLHPNISLQFFQLDVLSSDGYCKPFDDSDTGYMRSEVIAILYLQKKVLLEEFYGDCDVIHEMLPYMEARATGTAVGDPVEIDAIDQALCLKRSFINGLSEIKS
ncbi:PREDICTED: fatty acid synthase-like [Dinoponera quadriceps]|uniref:Fatty acid synthase-like n=1 Tax=Dinoponera quadriceps TaxID=609295 RepID=A0A6P3XA78_DINQU|nr:PREDICTED: fatty acid synthase-like [Dinoponera quadriceps]